MNLPDLVFPYQRPLLWYTPLSVFTQTLPLAWAAEMSALEAAGPGAAFDAVFFGWVLVGVIELLDAAPDFAGAEVGALVVADEVVGEAPGAGVAAGAIVLSLAADFLPLFLLDVLAGALAAGAFEDPVPDGVDVSAAADFLLFFLLLVEAAVVSLEPVAGAIASEDFLLFLLLLVDVDDVEDVSGAPGVAVVSVLAVFLLLDFLDFVPVVVPSLDVVA